MQLIFFKFKENTKSFMNRFKKARIKAVHDSDLVGVLESLGVFERVQNETEKCVSCSETVTIENLAAIFLSKGKIKFICSKNDCVSKL